MRFRRLGPSGLVVSVVGLGTNNFGMKLDGQQSTEVVHAALDEGITLFDTSDSYGESEERLGVALAGRRDDVVIATKFGSDVRQQPHSNGEDWDARASRRYIRRAVERSLRRLRTEWIDLYQQHVPDPATPIGETLSVLTDLVHEGKVRYIGSSNFAGWQVADADWTSRTRNLERFISAQNQYSLLERTGERDLVPALEAHGIGLLPFFPLASGKLTGKYRRGEEPPADSRIQAFGHQAQLTGELFDQLEALEGYARARGVTLLDVAIGALAAKPAVTSVIAGATSREQVAANVAAGSWQPTPEDLADLDKITSGP